MLEDRLLRLLDAEQLSSSKFSDVIGVQRSSVSHILSGRNKPSFDFIKKTLKAFPYLNADWLILGDGKMYNTEDTPAGGSLFDQPILEEEKTVDLQSGSAEKTKSDDQISPLESNISVSPESSIENKSSLEGELAALTKVEADVSKKLKRIILLYDDNSFESYEQGD